MMTKTECVELTEAMGRLEAVSGRVLANLHAIAKAWADLPSDDEVTELATAVRTISGAMQSIVEKWAEVPGEDDFDRLARTLNTIDGTMSEIIEKAEEMPA